MAQFHWSPTATELQRATIWPLSVHWLFFLPFGTLNPRPTLALSPTTVQCCSFHVFMTYSGGRGLFYCWMCLTNVSQWVTPAFILRPTGHIKVITAFHLHLTNTAYYDALTRDSWGTSSFCTAYCLCHSVFVKLELFIQISQADSLTVWDNKKKKEEWAFLMRNERLSVMPFPLIRKGKIAEEGISYPSAS